MVTTNPRAIATEEVDLVACPKCLLKHSKVCGWTLRAEPGGSSEPGKFLPVLKLFFLVTWPTSLWGGCCTVKGKFEMDVWEFYVENKEGNTLIRIAKDQAEWRRDVTVGSLRPWAPLCTQFIFKILLPKKSPLFLLWPYSLSCLQYSSIIGFLLQQGAAKHNRAYPASAHVLESDLPRRSHRRAKKPEQHKRWQG